MATYSTWRIVVVLMAAQIPGAALAQWLNPTGDWYMNCWYGAAFAAPIGFVGGVLWQIQVDVGSLRDFRGHVFGYGLFSAALPTFGALSFDVWTRAAV